MTKLSILFALLTFVAVPVIRGQDAPAAAPDLVGTWDVTTVSPMGETTNTMVVTKEGDALKAVVRSPQGELPYDSVSLKGSAVQIVLTIDFQGSPMIITYNGTLAGAKIEGACDFGGLAEGTWSAVRK
jgi:hypothetical protein